MLQVSGARAETCLMAAVPRRMFALLAAFVVGAMLWLAVPRPGPVAVRDTPLAPTGQIQKAEDASALSDASNRRLQQRLEDASR